MAFSTQPSLQTRPRPFSAQRFACKQLLFRSTRPPLCIASAHKGEQLTLASNSNSTLKAALGLGVGLTTAFWPAIARAVVDEDIINEATEAVLAASQREQSGYDLFVSIIFGIVVVLLSIVSLGVGYLSLKTWLDSRQEQEDKQAEQKAKSLPSSAMSSSKADKSKDESEEAALLSLRKASRASKDKTKGFGSPSNLAKNPKEF